jgi:porphobilinogen synthase
MGFPQTRLRRLRGTSPLRDLVRETTLAPSDLVAPFFVHAESGRAPIDAMPGQARLGIDELVA